jgi:adenylylsulfate kinase
MKILVMGLPGSGKTWLSERLQKELECAWYNADEVRKMANDWDFSPEGRVRQANRMKTFADYEKSHKRYVICDFVCPTQQTREAFNPDLVIWLNTITEGRFEDTNAMFEKPNLVDWVIDKHLTDEEIKAIAEEIKLAV